MPELPEVETTRRGVLQNLKSRNVKAVTIRNRQLRWPITRGLKTKLAGEKLIDVKRRAKYLLFDFERGTLLVHLGMTGSLRVLPEQSKPAKHDHWDIQFGQQVLRFTDPRKFGATLWTSSNPLQHKLLKNLGPEPLSQEFTPQWLYSCSRKRTARVKSFIMDQRIVVGVGNIYASEALFRAGVHPLKTAGKVTQKQYGALRQSIIEVLSEAIEQGGTSLRDFSGADGKPGYFKVRLQVYDRAGEPCVTCSEPIKQRVIGQRSSYYCTTCQS